LEGAVVLQAVSPPPGPKGLALPGLGKFLTGDLLECWRDQHALYGDTVLLKVGPLEVWSFAGPEAIHQALVTEHRTMRKGWGYAGLRKLLGEGLITTDGGHWAGQRQALNPLFSPSATEDYAGAIFDAVETGVEELERKARNGETVDVGEAMLRLTMRVISRAAFGVDLGEGHDDVAWAFSYAFNFVAMSMARPIRPPLFVPTRANRDYRRASRIIERFISGLIDDARAHPDASSMNGQIMQALAANPRQMLRDEVISLYFAGFETTARTMTFLMYQLGRHPELRELARSEAVSFGRPPGAMAVLKQLPISCEIVNETLRLYPPVALLARQPRNDVEIGGYPVKAGSLMILVPLLAQRDPRYWPAGDSFAPDPANPLPKRLAHKGAFVPFGGGPRVCLGKHFAMVEMAIATAMLSNRLDWTLLDAAEPELEFNGTIHPKRPLRAAFRVAT
jgi:cytochrome P450